MLDGARLMPLSTGAKRTNSHPSKSVLSQKVAIHLPKPKLKFRQYAPRNKTLVSVDNV